MELITFIPMAGLNVVSWKATTLLSFCVLQHVGEKKDIISMDFITAIIVSQVACAMVVCRTFYGGGGELELFTMPLQSVGCSELPLGFPNYLKQGRAKL